MIVRFAAPALILALTATTFADEPNLKALRKEIDNARKANGVPGLSIAVVKDGKVVFSEGFGYRDVEKKLPATPTTAYEIGSSTKAFTALLTTQAATEGKLAITDSPSKYLPSFKLKDPDTDAKITLADMMSHRSGLPRTDLAWYSNGFTRDELMQIVGGVEPTAKLGQKWQYQNLMFLFTGMIDEKVYGKSYETLIQEKFFIPLQMNASSVTYDGFIATPERAIGYVPGGMKALPVHRIDVCAPAGSIGSTVTDMAKYVSMLLADGQYQGKTIFSKEAIEETRKVRMSMAPGTPMNYGFGWMLHPFEDQMMVEHGGNIDGFNAEVALIPKQNLGVVVLTNVSASPAAMQAAQAALRAYLPPKAKPAADPKTAAAPAAKVTKADEAPENRLGSYQIEFAKIELKFTREGGKTFFEQDGRKYPLVLVGPGRYETVGIPAKAVFTFSADPSDPKKTVAILEQGGGKITMKAVKPYKAPMTGQALLAKVVEAQGGAEALRSHQNSTVHFQARMQSDGIDLEGVRYRRPNQSAEFLQFYALRKKFGTDLSNCDGLSAGEYPSFSQPSVKTRAGAADQILEANTIADIEPSRWYKALEITGEDKVGGEEVFVLKKTPFAGSPVIVYVSKATSRVLRQDLGGAAGPKSEFSDFRNVDGVIMPFHAVTSAADGGKTVLDITSVDFVSRIPDWPFKAPATSLAKR